MLSETSTQVDYTKSLETFFTEVGEPWRVLEWAPLNGGRSATSLRILLESPSRQFDAVLHIQPEDGPLGGISDAKVQFELLEALRHSAVRAPVPLMFLPQHVLGQPAFLTDFCRGTAPDPWRSEGRSFLAANRPILSDAILRQLVAVHTVPLGELPRTLRGNTPDEAPFFEREFARWSSELHESPTFAADPVLAYADAWLASRRPEPVSVGLMHGDFRIGNFVFEDGAVACVLDWELSEVGDPRYDLATLCSPALRIDGLAAGLFEPEELVSRYEQLIGLSVDPEAFEYFRVLSTFKIACLWIRSSRAFFDGKDDLNSLRAVFSAVDVRVMLAEALGLPLRVPHPGCSGVPDRALVVVAKELRKVVRAMPAGAERELVGLSSAIVEARARPVVAVPPEPLAEEIASLVAITRNRGLEENGAEHRTWAALANAAREILADGAVASDVGHPLHARLRAAIADAASLTTFVWAQT